MLLTAVTLAPSNSPASDVCASSFTLAPSTEFPISYWWGPPAKYNTLKHYQTIKDAHFTFAGISREYYSPADNIKKLELSEQVGLKALILDPRFYPRQTLTPNWKNEVNHAIKDYSNLEALYGYYVSDEPGHGEFKSIRLMNDHIYSQDSKHLAYTNLHPIYAGLHHLETASYEKYVRDYMKIVEPAVLSYDHYTIIRKTKNYFSNLSIIRTNALQNNVPAWNIIQGPGWAGRDNPTMSELRFQVYTSLTYGIKGLMYFFYWPLPMKDNPNYKVGLVTNDGTPTPQLKLVSDLNQQVQNLAPYIMDLESTGVYHTGLLPENTMSLPQGFPIEFSQDQPLVIGDFLNSSGEQYVFITNRDMTKDQLVRLKVITPVSHLDYINAEDGNTYPLTLKSDGTEINLAPGEGKLLKVIRSNQSKLDYKFDVNDNSEGWSKTQSLKELQIANGLLKAKISHRDPFFFLDHLKIPGNQYNVIKIKMKLPKGTIGQLRWTTKAEPIFSSNKSLKFETRGDDQFHEYTIPVGSISSWSEQEIRSIWFYPSLGHSAVGEVMEIDYFHGE